MFTESFEYFSGVLLMGCKVLGIDEDVVQIDNDAYIKHIGKDAIDKALESCWSIRKSLGHNQPFVRSITGPECSFPLISFCYPDKMISRLEVNFSVNFCTAR
jgi:hypothetical protein